MELASACPGCSSFVQTPGLSEEATGPTALESHRSWFSSDSAQDQWHCLEQVIPLAEIQFLYL